MGTPDAPLPVQLTRFIGREREMIAVRQLLGTTRLLTLTGAGGSGKTRLALEVAAQVAEEYPAGIAWVELAALTDPELLPQQIAAALGMREDPGRSATEALLGFLREHSLLLVLDNCEHLVDACAALADTLLRGCPGLKILATSREALGVAGERAWLVPPLSVPDADTAPQQLSGFEAVQLFVARAQDVLPGFELTDQNAAAVAQSCRRLDGIPLALELAAARVKVLTPEQIALRLDNVFALLTSGSRTVLPRHRTLRATIDWSYVLLSEPEQLLLQRLSVFAGGFTLEAAEAVCADERLEAWEVLDLLARLVDRSLVVVREQEAAARYHLLEAVRQYARERLEEHGEADAMRHRHADFFLALAETAAPRIYMGGSDSEWLAQLDAEAGNLRAAADWFEATAARTDEALRLATALLSYWYQRDTAEGRQRFERALERAGGCSPVVRARALVGFGATAFWQGDIPSMQAALAQAFPILRAHDEKKVLAEALAWAGRGMVMTGEQEGGWAAMEEALTLARGIGGALLVHIGSAAGYVAYRRSEYALARELFEESLQLARELGLASILETFSPYLARVLYVQGDLAGAAAYWRQSLTSRSHLHQHWAKLFAVEGLAVAAGAGSDLVRAARLLGAAEMIRERLGTALRPWEEVDRPVVEGLRAALGEAPFEAAFTEGRALSPEQAVEYALAGEQEDAGASPAVSKVAPAATSRIAVESSSAVAVPALRVLALGPLEIYREGEPLPPDLWRYARPKELLLYLLSHPEGRTREQIGLVFWPDASPAQVKNSFHVTLHHLRKALGSSEWVVFENERYRINEALGYEFDAALFEQQITAALREARSGSGSVEQLREALALYRGDFLEEESAGDWHLETRDHLRRLYVEGLFALGELLLQSEQYGEAAEVYQQIVRKEDLQEEAHRRLMLCRARMGQRAEALRHYERLVRLLAAELDAEPEEETTDLYDRLRQAEPV